MFSLCIPIFIGSCTIYLSEFFVNKHHKYPVKHKYVMYNPSDHQIHPLSTGFNSLLKVIRSSNTVWTFKKQLIMYFSTPLIPSSNHSCVQFPCYLFLLFFLLAHNTKHYNAIKKSGNLSTQIYQFRYLLYFTVILTPQVLGVSCIGLVWHQILLWLYLMNMWLI